MKKKNLLDCGLMKVEDHCSRRMLGYSHEIHHDHLLPNHDAYSPLIHLIRRHTAYVAISSHFVIPRNFKIINIFKLLKPHSKSLVSEDAVLGIVAQMPIRLGSYINSFTPSPHVQ
jgi:hypothetical protein